jgi:hypothetical protein
MTAVVSSTKSSSVSEVSVPPSGPAPARLILAAINPATTVTPVIINPGQTATINVTITPSGASGSTVSGTLYADDLLDNVPPAGQFAANELAALPYSYTIK